MSHVVHDSEGLHYSPGRQVIMAGSHTRQLHREYWSVQSHVCTTRIVHLVQTILCSWLKRRFALTKEGQEEATAYRRQLIHTATSSHKEKTESRSRNEKA